MESLTEIEQPSQLPRGVLRVRSNGKRLYADEFKAELVRQCLVPGTSVAATGLAHGINANLLRRWIVASAPLRRPPATALATSERPIEHDAIIELFNRVARQLVAKTGCRASTSAKMAPSSRRGPATDLRAQGRQRG